MRRASSSALKVLQHQPQHPCIASHHCPLTIHRYSSAAACVMRRKTDSEKVDYLDGESLNIFNQNLQAANRFGRTPEYVLRPVELSSPSPNRSLVDGSGEGRKSPGGTSSQATPALVPASKLASEKITAGRKDHASYVPNATLNGRAEQGGPSKHVQNRSFAKFPRKPRIKQHLRDRVIPLTRALEEQVVERAWMAFRELRAHQDTLRAIPTHQLHALFDLLANHTHITTRATYDRLYDIVQVLRHRGPGSVREWEWNSLIFAAAKGFRKTTTADYQSAVAVLEEWRKEAISTSQSGVVVTQLKDRTGKRPRSTAIIEVLPTMTTFNILISIACHTDNLELVRDAHLRWRLYRPRVKADRYTYISLIVWYQRTQRIRRIPALVKQMLDAKLDIGIHGVNTIIWAYAKQRQSGDGEQHPDGMATAKEIYDLLLENDRYWALVARDPKSPLPNANRSHFLHNPILGMKRVVRQLLHVVPDHRTHVMMIQQYAYQGDLENALRVLQNLLSLFKRQESETTGGRGEVVVEEDERSCLLYSCDVLEDSAEAQLMSAFRGLFKAFARHGKSASSGGTRRDLTHLMSLREATSMAVQSGISHSSQSTSPAFSPTTTSPEPNNHLQRLFALDPLLYVFHTYMHLSSSHPFAAARRLPSVSFVRDILMAFTNAGLGDNPLSNRELLRGVWQKLVRDRLAVCGDEWEDVKDTWTWKKVRRDFRIDLMWEKGLEEDSTQEERPGEMRALPPMKRVASVPS
ncbi:hypothetical protein FRB97_000594 [Tulasnella sp. 331]|nr:hypothetical protein FRB97_000594 [Tulasnella sp. 331]